MWRNSEKLLLHCQNILNQDFKSIYRVCHGFRSRMPDDCFRAPCDDFWSKRHFLRQRGHYLVEIALSWNQTNTTKFNQVKLAQIGDMHCSIFSRNHPFFCKVPFRNSFSAEIFDSAEWSPLGLAFLRFLQKFAIQYVLLYF